MSVSSALSALSIYVPRVEGEEGDAGVVPLAQHRVQLLLQGRRGLVQQHREAQPGGERVRLPAQGGQVATAGDISCHLKSARSCTISWPGGTTGMKMPFSSSLVQGMSEMATCMETWRGHTAWLLTADLHEVVVLPHHAVNLHTPLTVRQSDQNIGHI